MGRAASRRRAAVSRGTHRAWRAAATPATRSQHPNAATMNNRAKQPEAECPVCHAQVRQKIATFDEAGEYARTPGTRKGDLILGQHRFGGGNVIGRDTFACAGSKLKVARDAP